MTQTSQNIKVLVLDDYEGFAASVPAYEEVKARTQVVILRTKLKNDTELADALRDVQILLPVRERTKLGDKELALAPALKFISQTGNGIGHLDLAAATRRKIAVCLTGREPPVSTIELTMALILSCLRKIPLVDRRMREEAWPPFPVICSPERPSASSGWDGSAEKWRAYVWRSTREFWRPGKTLTDERARAAGATRVTMEELFRESDIVTVHAKSNQETRGLIGERARLDETGRISDQHRAGTDRIGGRAGARPRARATGWSRSGRFR